MPALSTSGALSSPMQTSLLMGFSSKTVSARFSKRQLVTRSPLVFPILRDPKASEIVFNRMVEAISKLHVDVDVIVGLDSRGFLFGPTLATRLNAGFVPIRKKGKVRSTSFYCTLAYFSFPISFLESVRSLPLSRSMERIFWRSKYQALAASVRQLTCTS